MAKSEVLQRHPGPAMGVARAQSAERERKKYIYTVTRCAVGMWDHERRAKIEAGGVCPRDREPQDEARLVAANMRVTPRFICENVYWARGDIKNGIGELLDGLTAVTCVRRQEAWPRTSGGRGQVT